MSGPSRRSEAEQEGPANAPENQAAPRHATGTLALDGEMTIYRAAELGQLLRDALTPPRAGAALDIDLAGVTEIDSSGVQLLMAAKRAARDAGFELRLHGHSTAVLEVFERLDLAAFFGDSLVVSA